MRLLHGMREPYGCVARKCHLRSMPDHACSGSQRPKSGWPQCIESPCFSDAGGLLVSDVSLARALREIDEHLLHRRWSFDGNA